jgi:hypothetical protein
MSLPVETLFQLGIRGHSACTVCFQGCLFPKHGYYFWPNKCGWMHAGFFFFFAPILIAHTQWRNRFFRSEKWPFYSSLPIVSVLKCWTYQTFVVAVLFSVLKDQCDGFYYCRGGNTRAFMSWLFSRVVQTTLWSFVKTELRNLTSLADWFDWHCGGRLENIVPRVSLVESFTSFFFSVQSLTLSSHKQCTSRYVYVHAITLSASTDYVISIFTVHASIVWLVTHADSDLA